LILIIEEGICSLFVFTEKSSNQDPHTTYLDQENLFWKFSFF